MIEKKKSALLAAAVAAFALGGVARATVQITEFESNSGDGTDHEYVELTNTGTTPVNMTGWSEDDSTTTPNKAGHSLTGLGILQPGQSGIITEATPADFKAYWFGPNLTPAEAALPVVGPYTKDNLSSGGDAVTLFNASNQLVDRVDYNGNPYNASTNVGGVNNPGTVGLTTDGNNTPELEGDASGVSRIMPDGYTPLTNKNFEWTDSAIGDSQGSFAAYANPADIGSPGIYVVPEPASLGLLAVAGTLVVSRRRRQA